MKLDRDHPMVGWDTSLFAAALSARVACGAAAEASRLDTRVAVAR